VAGTRAGEAMRPQRRPRETVIVARGLDLDRRAMGRLDCELGVTDRVGSGKGGME
jgi:hypothetical protein